MIESTVELDQTDSSSLGSNRMVHDLRAPLIIAIGYLEELRLFKLRLLEQLALEGDGRSLEIRTVEMAKEVDAEMGLCVDMIKESLDELDTKISGLRDLI